MVSFVALSKRYMDAKVLISEVFILLLFLYYSQEEEI
jgi:hypothetical protein